MRKKTRGPQVSLVASLEKNSKRWENNYCWAIDRTSNNHDDIQAMIIIQVSRPRLVDRVTPRDRCARCLPVIHCCCLVICLRVMHFISCHSCASHLHTCSSHASEHFPCCPFCIPALLCPPVSLSTSFRVWVLNIFRLDRDLSCGLGYYWQTACQVSYHLDFV